MFDFRSLIETNFETVALPTVIYYCLGCVGWIMVVLCAAGVIDAVKGIIIFLYVISSAFCLISIFLIAWSVICKPQGISSIYGNETPSREWEVYPDGDDAERVEV